MEAAAARSRRRSVTVHRVRRGSVFSRARMGIDWSPWEANLGCGIRDWTMSSQALGNDSSFCLGLASLVAQESPATSI